MFKVRIGLATSDREQYDRLADEIDSSMSDGSHRRDGHSRIENFAARHFQPDSPPVQFTAERLRRPLLAKNTVAERRASHLRPFVRMILITNNAVTYSINWRAVDRRFGVAV